MCTKKFYFKQCQQFGTIEYETVLKIKFKKVMNTKKLYFKQYKNIWNDELRIQKSYILKNVENWGL